jgi:RNA polymerase sigma-70 factor (sigma-E family)
MRWSRQRGWACDRALRVDDNRTWVAGVFIDVGVLDRVAGSSDRDEFERFAARVSPSLLRSAYLLTRDRGHAEDLLQMTLWRVARRWHAIEGAPEGYAHRVLVNLSRDRRRTLGRRAEERLDASTPAGLHDDATDTVAERDWMSAAVRRLPRRQREVIVLRFFLDLSVPEAAAALGMSQGTVKSHTSRALAQMGQLLNGSGTTPQTVERRVPHAD